MKIAVPSAKNILALLGITAAALEIAAGILKSKIHGSGNESLIVSNEEINDIIKLIQALEDSNILLRRVTKIIKNETKRQKGGFLSMFLGTLGASLLGYLWTGKGFLRAGSRIKKWEGVVRSGSGNNKEKGTVRVGTGKK